VLGGVFFKVHLPDKFRDDTLSKSGVKTFRDA